MAQKKVAPVTGGTAGLGEDIALHLLQEGYEVAACGRRVDKLSAMKARGVGVFQCDISNRDDVARMRLWLLQTYGQLDVLVNCAGIAVQKGPFVEISPLDIERLVQTNVLGTLYVTQAFLALLIDSKGCVVNFSSTLAQRPRAGSIVYSATKGAVEAFSRALAVEAAEHGVRVNCIAPALVRSDIYLAAGMSPADYDELLKARAKEFPLRRVGEPDDVTQMLSYLVSDKASWITGLCLPVDGGAMLR
jgi:3-oxoacyl-[acyl-carrier protein] reductase